MTKDLPGCFDCNHYTAKGEEKDSAFSNPKPKLLLTKPKLNVPKPDKKFPKVDKNLPFRRRAHRRIKTKKSPGRHIALSRGLYLSGLAILFVTCQNERFVLNYKS